MRTRRRSYLEYLRLASAQRRAEANDTILAVLLAFVAGGVNAGGFFAIGQYTSHMTGVVSALADNLALGALGLALQLSAMLAAFMGGAAASAILINWARKTQAGRQYAWPLALEGGLILVFGGFGAGLPPGAAVPAAGAMLLCFILGLQNATITKISHARMRTTHLTGMVTDMGIELGKAAFARMGGASTGVAADWEKLSLLSRIVGMFFAGGLAGAFAFAMVGYWFTLPLAGLLFLFSIPRIVTKEGE